MVPTNMREQATENTYGLLSEIPRAEFERAWRRDSERALLWLLGIPMVDDRGRPDPFGRPDERAWRGRGGAASRSRGERSCAALAVAMYGGSDSLLPSPAHDEDGEFENVAPGGSMFAALLDGMDGENFLVALDIIRLRFELGHGTRGLVIPDTWQPDTERS